MQRCRHPEPFRAPSAVDWCSVLQKFLLVVFVIWQDKELVAAIGPASCHAPLPNRLVLLHALV